jgi:hypothetical protein
MKTNEIIERFGATSLRANLPPGPFGSIADIARRACLRLRDRWFYTRSAICVAFLATGFLLAGVMVNHVELVLIGLAGIALAILLLFRLAPTKLTDQVARAEAESERIVAEFAGTCQNRAEQFGGTAMDAIRRETEQGVRSGETLTEVAEFKEQVSVAFGTIQSECATGLASIQAQCKTAQEELQRRRGQLTVACQEWKASFIPGPARRAAREVLNAVSKCSEARLREAAAKAEVRAYQLIRDGLDTLPFIPTIENPNSTCNPPAIPVWLGQTVPGFETLRDTAAALVESNISMIREKVVSNSAEQSPDEIVAEAIEDLFSSNTPGPHSVEEHVSGLNGGGKEWAERVLREALPFSPITPRVGRIRHRKCWCIAENGPGSTSFRNLRESFSDQTAKLFALEGPGTQMLFFDEERGVTPGEFDEFKPLFDAFRSLPSAEQRLLITGCDPEDLFNFYPEFGRDENRPARLLACSLVFEVIRRNGAELYLFEDQIIGKGFGTTLEAIRGDQRVAAAIASKLETTMNGLGSVVAAAKLKTAQSQAASYVPKACMKAFLAGVKDGLSELNRRGAATQ